MQRRTKTDRAAQAAETTADLEDQADLAGGGNAHTIAAGQLRSVIERVERLNEERQAITDDIKDVYAEAKGTGFDTVAIRTLIRLRKMDQAERQERESILDLYKSALGMV